MTRTALLQMLLVSTNLAGIPSASAQETTDQVTLELRPHCASQHLADDTLFGPVPSPEPMIELGEGRCSSFAVEDPQTLRTAPLKLNDTLDIDLIVHNPPEYEISRVRAWISYDPEVLQGVDIQVHEDFPTVTPGEEDFDEEEGYVMIDASAEEGEEPDYTETVVVRIQFRVIADPSGGTVLSFYDVQPGGHTFVERLSDASGAAISALETDPSSLLVIVAQDEGGDCESDLDCAAGRCIDNTCTTGASLLPDGASCLLSSQCENASCINGICASDGETMQKLPAGSACSSNDACASGQCTNGVCTVEERLPLLPNGSACTLGNECESGICTSGVCSADAASLLAPNGALCTESSECRSGTCSSDGVCGEPQEEEPTPPPTGGEQTAFSLLQVRNLRVTTQGDAAYLAWDPLQSSQLKAYNVYYGTTTGQYIQRKTVDGAMQSLTIRPLTEGVTEYFAIRAVSQSDEESAFSQEVAVMIGNPATSSSPLMLEGTSGLDASVSNPLEGGVSVPGETGPATILALLIVASAVIGTFFAARRQMLVTTQQP